MKTEHKSVDMRTTLERVVAFQLRCSLQLIQRGQEGVDLQGNPLPEISRAQLIANGSSLIGGAFAIAQERSLRINDKLRRQAAQALELNAPVADAFYEHYRSDLAALAGERAAAFREGLSWHEITDHPTIKG